MSFSVIRRPLIFAPLRSKASAVGALSNLKEAFPADLTEYFPLSYNVDLTLKKIKERNR